MVIVGCLLVMVLQNVAVDAALVMLLVGDWVVTVLFGTILLLFGTMLFTVCYDAILSLLFGTVFVTMLFTVRCGDALFL